MTLRTPTSLKKFARLAPAPLLVLAASVMSLAQYRKSELPPPPPPVPEYFQGTHIPDSVILPSPVQNTLPQSLEDYVGREYAADLSTPSNIKTEVVYDPVTAMYVMRTMLGDREIVTPFMMTPEEYNKVATRREMFARFQERNAEVFATKDK